MKYIDAEKLIAEIERFMNPNTEWKHLSKEEIAFMGRCKTYFFGVITFLQQEQPVEGLEEEIEEYYYEHFAFLSSLHNPTLTILSDIAEYFYEQGKKAMKEQMVKGADFRPSWKPSEEQMAALLWCAAHLGGADHRVLAELYEHLKKFKED